MLAPTLCLEDLHLGRLQPRKEESLNTLRAALTYAWHEKMNLVLNGDTLDRCSIGNEQERSDESKEAADMFGAYTAFSGKPIRIIPGNHDPDLTHERLDAFFPNVPFEISSAVHTENGVVFTHGHLLEGVRAVRSQIEKCLRGECSADELLEQLNSQDMQDAAAETMTSTAVKNIFCGFDLVGIHDWCERRLFKLVSMNTRLEQRLHDRSAHGGNISDSLPRGYNGMAAGLGVAMDHDVVVIGHNHVHGIVKRVMKDRSGEAQATTVANTGGWLGSDRASRKFLRIDDTTVSLLSIESSGKLHLEQVAQRANIHA